jgi:hypothetical protein
MESIMSLIDDLTMRIQALEVQNKKLMMECNCCPIIRCTKHRNYRPFINYTKTTKVDPLRPHTKTLTIDEYVNMPLVKEKLERKKIAMLNEQKSLDEQQEDSIVEDNNEVPLFVSYDITYSADEDKEDVYYEDKEDVYYEDKEDVYYEEKEDVYYEDKEDVYYEDKEDDLMEVPVITRKSSSSSIKSYDELNGMSVKQLKVYCKEMKIKGFSKYTAKNALLKFIRESYQ